jgi:uncharacterized protein YceK
MNNRFFRLVLAVTLIGSISGCSSANEEEDSDNSGSGGYIGCVLELSEARNNGIISATDAEIQAECRSQQLP